MLGPFEEEEEGISIASDVVKVKGEDPAPGYYLRSVDTREPRYRNDSPISDAYNKVTHVVGEKEEIEETRKAPEKSLVKQ